MKFCFAAFPLALTASTAAPPKPPSPPTPLFASNAPLRVTIQGPVSTIASNRSETPRPASMTVDGVTYPITLSARGITRKMGDICDFPPLRVELTAAAPPGSLFEHQHRLKLVTHCKRSADFQQKVLLEYSAYRLFNLITRRHLPEEHHRRWGIWRRRHQARARWFHHRARLQRQTS